MDVNERLIVRAEAAEIAVSEPEQSSAATWQGAKPIPFAISVGVGLLLRFAIPGQLSPSQNVGPTCDHRDTLVKEVHSLSPGSIFLGKAATQVIHFQNEHVYFGR